MREKMLPPGSRAPVRRFCVLITAFGFCYRDLTISNPPAATIDTMNNSRASKS
jgi:hypothetical protein